MFLLTQFIGLYVVDYYSTQKVVNGEVQNITSPNLPFGMENPEIEDESQYYIIFLFIIISFIIAITILFFFTKFEWAIILRLWFFGVITISLGISLFIFTTKLGIERNFFEIPIIATALAITLAFFKIFKKNFIIHNLTELFIYPGIAAVFVPVLNIYTVIILLILISGYDMWAVWKSGIMQKMAKYQMDKLNAFSGFFLPHADKKTKNKIKLIKKQLKEKKITKKQLAKKKFKVNVAILGGGDIIFPIITSGVVLKTFGLIPAIFVILGATLGLTYLFLISEKKKFYPAMPFITAGIFLGMLASWALQL